MLHALPALLDELERRLVVGEDPAPLLGAIRWPEIIGWPSTRQDAMRLKERLANIQMLLQGLQAPLRATLATLSPEPGYHPKGVAPLSRSFSGVIQESI